MTGAVIQRKRRGSIVYTVDCATIADRSRNEVTSPPLPPLGFTPSLLTNLTDVPSGARSFTTFALPFYDVRAAVVYRRNRTTPFREPRALDRFPTPRRGALETDVFAARFGIADKRLERLLRYARYRDTRYIVGESRTDYRGNTAIPYPRRSPRRAVRSKRSCFTVSIFPARKKTPA